MSQKSNHQVGKNPALKQKLSSLKEKQDKWMKERAVTKTNPKKVSVHSSLKEYGTSVKTKPKELVIGKDEVKKSDALLWTSGNPNQYNGFVVRNGSGKSSSRQNSARTPSAQKSYGHSSLRNHSSRPASASSSHFVKSKQQGISEKNNDNDFEYDANDDDSLSGSFSKNFAKLNFDRNYDFEKYKEISEESTVVQIVDSKMKNSKKSNQENRHFMENHYCSTCKNLMFEEKHIPQMVFPCGHTFCSQCIHGKKQCPSCKCEIISTEENDSLQAIIKKFKKKLLREELERKEKQTRQYLDEYKNLSTRIDLMKGEATTVIDEMEGITHQLIERRDSLRVIEESSTEIKKQQECLQKKLESLQSEQERESNNMIILEGDYNKQKKQLQMLEKTIKSIEQNRLRVKHLVEDLSPSSVPLLDAEE